MKIEVNKTYKFGVDRGMCGIWIDQRISGLFVLLKYRYKENDLDLVDHSSYRVSKYITARVIEIKNLELLVPAVVLEEKSVIFHD